jgi:hypothetical protein
MSDQISLIQKYIQNLDCLSLREWLIFLEYNL